MRKFNVLRERCFMKAVFGTVVIFAFLFGPCLFMFSQAADSTTSLEQIRVLADKGDAEAQTKLGSFYRTGEGITQNFQEAVKWYRKAAEQGVTEAQFRLGELYLDGKGIAKDVKEATKWLEKAAAQGFKNAKDKLKEIAGTAPDGIKELEKALDLIR